MVVDVVRVFANVNGEQGLLLPVFERRRRVAGLFDSQRPVGILAILVVCVPRRSLIAAPVPAMQRKQIQRLAAQGWDQDLLLPSELRTIAIKLDAFNCWTEA